MERKKISLIPPTSSISKQGLNGLRPVNTPLPGQNRVYHDRAYFLARIKAHAKITYEEIDRLSKETAKLRATAANRSNAKHITKRYAQQYEKLRDLLKIYNTVLRINMAGAKLEVAKARTQSLKEKDARLYDTLLDTYQYKKDLEKEVSELNKNSVQYQSDNPNKTVFINFLEHLREIKAQRDAFLTKKETGHGDNSVISYQLKSDTNSEQLHLEQYLGNRKKHLETLNLQLSNNTYKQNNDEISLDGVKKFQNRSKNLLEEGAKVSNKIKQTLTSISNKNVSKNSTPHFSFKPLTNQQNAEKRGEITHELLKQKQKSISQDLNLISNKNSELLLDGNVTHEKKKSLTQLVNSTNAALIEIENRLKAVNIKLGNNETYKEISKLEKQVTANDAAIKELEAEEGDSYGMKDLIENFEELLNQYNGMLISDLQVSNSSKM